MKTAVEEKLGELPKVEAIAMICHEANMAYCIALGDFSQKHWEDAADWQQESAIKGVEFALAGTRTPAEQHEAWLADKAADGWTYGTVKDADRKTHPCFVAYDKLPLEQRRKDALFGAVVSALK